MPFGFAFGFGLGSSPNYQAGFQHYLVSIKYRRQKQTIAISYMVLTWSFRITFPWNGLLQFKQNGSLQFWIWVQNATLPVLFQGKNKIACRGEQ